MAPRSTKTKKAADVKLAPKTGSGKEKILDELEFQSVDIKLDDKVEAEKEQETKQKSNPASDDNDPELNGIKETAPVKKDKKKNEPKIVGFEGIENSTLLKAGNIANGHSEDGGKGRKNKNDTEKSKPNKKAKRNKDENDDKPKTAKTRGRKLQPKIDEMKNLVDEEEDEPKAIVPSVNKKNQEQEEVNEIEELETKEVEEKAEPKTKGRRGKKAQEKVKVIDLISEEAPAPKKRKVAKKGKGDSKEEDDTPEVLPVKTKRGAKKAPVPEGDQNTENVTTKRGRKQANEKGEGKEENELPAKTKRGQKKAPVPEVDQDGESVVTKRSRPANDKGDSNNVELIEEKPKKRGQKKDPAEVEEIQDTGEVTKRRRKQPDDKVPNDDKKRPPLKNKTLTDYESIDFSNTSKTSQGKEWNFKISSWNVDGIRAWFTKGGLDYVRYEKPDILCLQEIKCSQDKFPDDIANLPGYHAYWLSGDKDGYAGVGIYTTKLAMNVQYGLNDEELDSEGRIITAEYEQFYLICTYVPNAGRKLVTLPKRLNWNEEFLKHVKQLDAKKPVIICGDMNVAHNEIDLANPKTNKKNAGFTEEERAGMSQLLAAGFVDTYRHLRPEQTGAYTFWTYMMNSRAKNVGWRLDYLIVSERLVPAVCDSVIRERVLGSDHCPVALHLHLSSAARPKDHQ